MAGPEVEHSTYQTENRTPVHTNNSAAAEENVTVEENIKPKISTLVFMDLESTGLPSDVGKRNVHITEICLVAVDRNSFEGDRNLRVLNKISLCVRPRFQISFGAMNVTGLYNDMLENQEEFDDSIPKLLEYFFRRLQKPICLLAHNGNRFDFPVLQAELNRINYTLGSDIVCADTLVAFRAISLSQKQALAAEVQKKADEAEEQERLLNSNQGIVISEKDIEDLLEEDLDSFSQINDSLLSVTEAALEPGLIEIVPSETMPEIDTMKITSGKEFLSPSLNEKTPQKIENTPHSSEKKCIRKRKIVDPTFHPRKFYNFNKKKIIPAKRNLFPEENESIESLEIHKITRFSLENLYIHFFHESPPKSHYAEMDCISLSKVCQRINKDFLQWIDENSVAFSTIDALW